MCVCREDRLRETAARPDWETKLKYAVQCAKAVAFLHSRSPPIVHLDIKSSNFLINKYNTVKIADLELSRKVDGITSSSLRSQTRSSSRLEKGFQEEEGGTSLRSSSSIDLSGDNVMSGSLSVPSSSLPLIPDVCNWLAPELIKGEAYDERADIYSLACVLWEIVTCKIPYADFEPTTEQLLVAELPSDSRSRRASKKTARVDIL